MRRRGLRKSRTSGDRNPRSLRVEQDGRLCRIALAAPDKRNVLDADTCRKLLHELESAEADLATWRHS